MDLQQLQNDPAQFRQQLRIDADGRTVRLSENLDSWQRRDFLLLDDGWKSVAGHANQGSILRAWLERPRGHSKSTDIATMVSWVLFASKRQISGIAAAGDKDQAKILRDAIDKLVRLNPWLSKILDVQAWKVINRHTGSILEIISSDAMTSYGALVDFIVCDELCHWKSDDLWKSLFSTSAKRRNCMLICISNAGWSESWQWELREAIREDNEWLFSRLDGPKASWISQKRLAEQQRLLPDIAFRRLWLNEWSSGSGDALSGDDIARSIRLHAPLTEAEPGWMYVAGVDLGLTRDCSAVVVIGKHVGRSQSKRKSRRLSRREEILIDAGLMEEPIYEELIETVEEPTGKIQVADVRLWRPENGRRVSVEAVEKTILRLHQKFNLQSVGFDPWQAAMLQERISKTIHSVDVPFTGPNLQSMCSVVLESFSENMIELFDHTQLLSDLRNLRVVEKSYGVRLDSPRGGTISGHGDCATALSIALHILKSSNIALDSFSPSDRIIAHP